MEPCLPGAPGPESCDGVDNSCNGLVDDGLPTDARCFNNLLGGHPGRGACTYGAYRCIERSWTCVTLGTGLPQSEVCNGRDDDCNGLVDEIPERQPDGTERPCPSAP